MTKYHSDDYIKFLYSIRPDNMNDFNKQMQRCEWIRLFIVLGLKLWPLKVGFIRLPLPALWRAP